VLEHCEDIPQYTPIATFKEDVYDHSGAESGILLECIDGGFLVINKAKSLFDLSHDELSDMVIYHKWRVVLHGDRSQMASCLTW